MDHSSIRHLVQGRGRRLFVVTGLIMAVIAAGGAWIDSFPAPLAIGTTVFCLFYVLMFWRFLRAQREMEEHLNIAREASEKALQARREFLSTISHEVRTPMNAIIGMTSLLRGTQMDARQEEFTRAIDQSAQALLDIIDDILDFSRVEADKLQLESVSFDPAELAETCTDILAHAARNKGLRLLCHTDANLPARVQGDAVRLRQILLNLIGNAVKFTDAGDVTVRIDAVMQSEGRCRLRAEVQDTGIGMDDAILRRLFEPFTQADGSITRKYGGTGLGLAICKRLAALMNGEIVVTSIPGQGTCFRLELELPVLVLPTPVASAGQRHVLLLEPHEASARMMGDYLAAAGIVAARVKSASDALFRAQTAEKDTVVIFSSETRDMPVDAFATALHRLAPDMRCLFLDHGIDKQQVWQGDPARRIHLPLKRSALLHAIAGDAVTADIPAAPWPLTAPLPAQASILLVEDNLMNQQVVYHQLHALGLAVDIAKNGREGLDMLGARDYALVLMDCQMPVMDGYEATRRIRSLEAEGKRSVPIVAMTANTMLGDRELCLASGMNDYVTKPLKKGQLEEVVRKYLRQPLH